jgi:hypothetical protein
MVRGKVLAHRGIHFSGDSRDARSRVRSANQLVWQFFRLLAPFRWQVFWILGSATAATLIGLLPPAATKFIVDYGWSGKPVPAPWLRRFPSLSDFAQGAWHRSCEKMAAASVSSSSRAVDHCRVFHTSAFPTDIGTFADFNLHTTLQPTNAPADFYPVFSNDPINGQYGVPEPMSLVLVGQLACLMSAFSAVVRTLRKY